MAEIPEVFDQPGAGFVLLRDGEKFPPIEKAWQTKPHSFEEAIYHTGNVGVLAGNGYIGLDQDDPAAFKDIGLPATNRWQTRPARLGMWFKADDVAAALKAIGKKPIQAQIFLFKNGKECGEIKLQNSYQIIPPSHKYVDPATGETLDPKVARPDFRVDYTMVDERPPAIIKLADLLAILKAAGISFSSKLDKNAAKLEAHGKEVRRKRAAAVASELNPLDAYTKAAVRSELSILGAAVEGERNNQLNRSAFALGQLVGSGRLREDEAAAGLLYVARQIGLEEEEVMRTIRSGLESGMKEPRIEPEPGTGDIQLEEIVEIEVQGRFVKKTFRPSWAAAVVLSRIPLAMESTSDDIYYYDGQIYQPDGARKIDIALCKAANDLVTADKLKETLRRVRNELKERPVEFDHNPYLLGLMNGVADLSTGQVREYRPEDLITDRIPVYYDPAARCPAFLAFLESITPNPSDRITLIDWIAAHAIRLPLPHVLFLLGLGRNGKGIYEKLLKAFFGLLAFRDMSLSEISRNNFAASGFYRKRGWIASETGRKKDTIGTDFMKLTSGNGIIDGDRKNQSRIQFEPFFQTTVDTNTMPQIEDSSIGWMERFIKVDLPYTFVPNPDESNPLEKLRDPDLFEKLSTPSELSGILNLILYRSPEICRSKTIHKRPGKDMFAEYAEQSSSVRAFLDEFCEYDSTLIGLRTPSEPIYEAYHEWCNYKVGEFVNKVYFGRQLKKFCGGIEPRRGQTKDRQRRTTEYQGLIFDSNKYRSVLAALKLSVVQVESNNVQVESKKEEDKQCQQIAILQDVQVKSWIDIVERFGAKPKEEFGAKPVEDLSLSEEHINLLGLPGLLVQSAAEDADNETSTCAHPVQLLVQTAVDAQDVAREKHFSEKAAEISASAPVDHRTTQDDPGFKQFKERMSRRKCILCGRSFPYDLTPYFEKGISGYICTTCHMEGTPVEPEATRQEMLPEETQV